MKSTNVSVDPGDRRKPEDTRSLFPERFGALLTLFCLLLMTGKALAAGPEALSQSQIEAGFIFNFTRFVEWPDNSFATPASPFTICVVGAPQVAELLAVAAFGKEVGGRRLTIKTSKSDDDVRTCQILYFGGTEEHRAVGMSDSVKEISVLTVSNVPGFASAGGMIGFFVQDNKVKLEINADATAHARLKVSSKLIAIAQLVAHNPASGGH
jgi:hypothetical protein